MAKFGFPLRRSQHRWIGVRVGFNEQFNAFLKAEVPTRAWDGISKTWWFPEQYEHIVRDKLVGMNLISPDAASAWVREFHFHDQRIVDESSSVEPEAENKANVRKRKLALIALGLDPQAEPPSEFVKQAYWYWKQKWTQEAVFNRLAEVEEAWAFLNENAGSYQ